MRHESFNQSDTWEWLRATTDDSARIADLERNLALCNAAFNGIVDRSADGVVVIDLDGKICFANPAAEQLFDRRASELIGHNFGQPITESGTVELDLIRDGQRNRIVEMRLVPTEWQGKPASLATLRDITERKLAEERAKDDLKKRDVFLASLSHELRNPLAAISSAAAVLRREPNSSDIADQASEIIERQAAQMTRLLEDLLDVTRISQGKIHLLRERLDFRVVMKEAIRAVDSMLQARSQNIVLDFQAETILVKADSARLHQIFVNLLSNASKYSKPGTTIWVTVRKRSRKVQVEVRDEGIGIDAKSLPQIFEPFFQHDAAQTHSKGGLGIGLALVKNLVELHRGRIQVTSPGLGKGSEFTVVLPRIPSKSTLDPAPQPPDFDETMRILIVEDTDDVRRMLKMLLELHGFEVETANDGERGVEMIEFQKPNIAFVDIGLPGIDGYEVARRVRSKNENNAVRLVALTGYGQKEDLERAFNAGFDHHLAKPVDMTELIQLLAEHSQRIAQKSTS